MNAAKGRGAFVEWRAEYGRAKMKRDYGNKGAEAGRGEGERGLEGEGK